LLNVLSVSSLKIHLQSKDDDLQLQILKSGDEYNFSFHSNFFGTTLFYCNFAWATLASDFQVYHKGTSPCRFHYVVVKDLYCTWLVKDSGIYIFCSY
ncbi:hypothetical protein T459_24460, partial [Capsicum annuum]